MKITEAIKILAEAGIDDPRREARLLFSKFTPLTEIEIYSPDAECDSEQLLSALERRAKRYPLQYIIGEVDFYRESYKITESCLIPRSDTEILVEEAIKRLPSGAHFIDLCTGSGCVGLSILNNTSRTSAALLDISEPALETARENAARLSLTERAEFILGDAKSLIPKRRFFAVISNPPYVSADAYRKLEPEIYCEPKIAFLGGEDGLDFYRAIIPLYKEYVDENGFFAFEIGYDQADAVKQMAEENSLFSEIIKDYSSNDRVAILTFDK